MKRKANLDVKAYMGIVLFAAIFMLVGFYAYSRVGAGIPRIGDTLSTNENVTALNETVVALTYSDTIASCNAYNGSDYTQALASADYVCNDSGLNLLNDAFNNTAVYVGYNYFSPNTDANNAIINARANINSSFDLGSIVFIVLAAAMVIGALYWVFV